MLSRAQRNALDGHGFSKVMHSLEALLHSWQPRRPSARLKWRLSAEPSKSMPRMAWFAGWLVPATACVLLAFFAVTSGNNASGHASLRTGVLSDRIHLPPVPASSDQGENNLLFVTFDLTNRTGSTSSIAPFSPREMN